MTIGNMACYKKEIKKHNRKVKLRKIKDYIIRNWFLLFGIIALIITIINFIPLWWSMILK